MSRDLLTVYFFTFCLQIALGQYNSYGSGYANSYGNKMYNPVVGYNPVNTGIASNLEFNQANLAGLTPTLATGLAPVGEYGVYDTSVITGTAPVIKEVITGAVPVIKEVSSGFGGSGTGEVLVIGEMPVVGSTMVGGAVPITGSVRFAGDVPAGGTISVAATCGCGLGEN